MNETKARQEIEVNLDLQLPLGITTQRAKKIFCKTGKVQLWNYFSVKKKKSKFRLSYLSFL